jgi:CHAD domain-containing protein
MAGIAAAVPRDVHQARVAARRLRSLLKTFAPLLVDGDPRRYRQELRRMAGLLAELRQIDVMAQLEPLRTPALAAALVRRRAVAVRRLRASLRTRSPRRGDGMRPIEVAPAATEADLLRRVRRCWRRAAALLDTAPESPEVRHDLRIALKHCRYSLEIVDHIEPAKAARLMRRLRTAQQLLGDQRDLVLTVEWLGGAAAPRAVPRAERQRAVDRLARIDRRMERRVREALDRLELAGARWERALKRLIPRAR